MGKFTKHWMMAVDAPDDISLSKHIGRSVKVTDDTGKERVVEIETVQGNLAHLFGGKQPATKLQINSNGESFLISALDFFAQMNGETVSKEEIELFDQTTFHVEYPKGMFHKKRGLWRSMLQRKKDRQ